MKLEQQVRRVVDRTTPALGCQRMNRRIGPRIGLQECRERRLTRVKLRDPGTPPERQDVQVEARYRRRRPSQRSAVMERELLKSATKEITVSLPPNALRLEFTLFSEDASY